MKDYFKRFISMNKNSNPILLYLLLGIIAMAGVMLLGKIAGNPKILIIAVAFYFAIVIHEIAHGVAAYAFGDPTAKIAGRFSLNPIKHLDPIGTIIPALLIVVGFPFVIGWAKPVPVNYRLLKNKTMGIFTVSIAGIVANILMIATGILFFIGPGIHSGIMLKLKGISMGVMTILGRISGADDFSSKMTAIYNYSPNFNNLMDVLGFFFIWLILINAVLAVFNLIPCPPLDGSRIIYALSNNKGRAVLDSIEKYGFIIILILLWTGIITMVMSPIMDGIYKYIFGLIGI